MADCCHSTPEPFLGPSSRRQNPGQSTVKAEPLEGSSAQQKWTCPMHPEVVQNHPGTCPECGMVLEPPTPVPSAKQRWTCPMHPEIVRDAPGDRKSTRLNSSHH